MLKFYLKYGSEIFKFGLRWCINGGNIPFGSSIPQFYLRCSVLDVLFVRDGLLIKGLVGLWHLFDISL